MPVPDTNIPKATAKPNRKEFRRTKISKGERSTSAALLVLIAGIGAVVWNKGRHFDPNRFALRVEALKSTSGSVEGKASTLRLQGGVQPGEEGTTAAVSPSKAAAPGGEAEAPEGSTEGGTSSKPAVKGEPLEPQIPGLKPMSDTEFYSADNLFEKIDGRAPAYLNFNFQQLRCRTFSVAGATGSFVDLYEFRFDTPVNAFGMFALERDPKGASLPFAADGYSGEMGFFFRQGAVYLQVIASDQNPKTLALARAISQDRAGKLPADDKGLDGRRRLPASGMDPGSVQFVQDNAQGQAFLKDVFQATYDFGGDKLPFFVMVAKPADAAAAWKSYLAFSSQFGGKAEALPDANGAKMFKAENFGTWKVIYQREGEVGGVVDAKNGSLARQFVEQYLSGKIK